MPSYAARIQSPIWMRSYVNSGSYLKYCRKKCIRIKDSSKNIINYLIGGNNPRSIPTICRFPIGHDPFYCLWCNLLLQYSCCDLTVSFLIKYVEAKDFSLFSSCSLLPFSYSFLFDIVSYCLAVHREHIDNVRTWATQFVWMNHYG